MAISESSVSRSFMDELQWAKDTIKGLDEYKSKN